MVNKYVSGHKKDGLWGKWDIYVVQKRLGKTIRRTFREGGHIKTLFSNIRRTFKDVGHIRTLFPKICRTFKDVGHIRTLFSKICRTFKDVGHIRTQHPPLVYSKHCTVVISIIADFVVIGTSTKM